MAIDLFAVKEGRLKKPIFFLFHLFVCGPLEKSNKENWACKPFEAIDLQFCIATRYICSYPSFSVRGTWSFNR